MKSPLTDSPPLTDASEEARAGRRKVWRFAAGLSVLALAAAGLFGWRALSGGAAAGDRTRQSLAPLVRVAAVVRGSLTLERRYAGELIADVADLAAKTQGQLLSVNVDLGDHFVAGELLAEVDSAQARRQVSVAEAEISLAQAAERRSDAQLAAARVALDRGRALGAEEIISGGELDELSSRVDTLEADVAAARAQRGQAEARRSLLRQQLSDTRLLAPFAGAVAERQLDPGALVQPGTRVLRLVKSGPLQVRFRVPERELSGLAEGLPLTLTTQADPGTPFHGQVRRLSAQVSPVDRTLLVEGVVDGETPALRAGMYAQIVLSVGELSDVTLVPGAALVERLGSGGEPESGAYVVESGVAHFRVLSVLGRAGQRAAVDGLEAGDRVITLGHEQLHDGASVRVVDSPDSDS